tara:strand:- start:145 stop:423 length:279 start_codon:yes stop_codon:yes gene_type:complete
MTATTSMQAYKDIVSNGTTLTQQQIIIDILSAVGRPLSSREIMAGTGLEINAISGRVNDLKKAGKLIAAPKRRCTVSKKLITPVTTSWLNLV